MINFDEYLDWRVTNDMYLQKRYFFDEKDQLIVDFVGRLENLNDDFENICKIISINSTLPHLNQSRGNNNIKEYYSKESIDFVYDAFKEDIITFGYSKPDFE